MTNPFKDFLGDSDLTPLLDELRKIRIATELQAALSARTFFQEQGNGAATEKLARIIQQRASALTKP